MAKGKSRGGDAPYHLSSGGSIITPISGFASGSGFGTPSKPGRRGEPKEPGTGQIPTGGSSGREAGTALSQAFGFGKGRKK